MQKFLDLDEPRQKARLVDAGPCKVPPFFPGLALGPNEGESTGTVSLQTP